MTHVADIKLVVVFEEELVRAAKSLEPFAPTSKEKPTKQQAEEMLKACFAALYSPALASGKCPVTVIRSHDITK